MIGHYETDLPTKQAKTKKNTRVSLQNENRQRTKVNQPQTSQRAETPSRVKLTFPSTKRLLRKRDFRRVYDEGKRSVGKGVTFFYRVDGAGASRLGITITKKWGKAHERSRFKRVIREAFRTLYPIFPAGLAINVHPREGYRELTSKQVENELKTLAKLCDKTQPTPTASRHHH